MSGREVNVAIRLLAVEEMLRDVLENMLLSQRDANEPAGDTEDAIDLLKNLIDI